MALAFDANYYLSTRPDVFNAFVATAGATGQTWAQFASAHYNNFGRFEGSNPNSTFNTREYLSANPDVAAAGVNPFTHFLNFGAKEGRAPSASFPSFASFDEKAYLAANADLGTAGITTKGAAYEHFVKFGQFEGRPGAPAVDTGVPGQTFTLTTGADAGAAFTGGANADIFVATEATLSSADALDGGAGVDTLRYASSGPAAIVEAGFTAVNIENVEITTDVVGGTTFDVTGVSNVALVTNTNSSTNLTLLGGKNITDVAMTSVSNGNTAVTYQAAAVAGTADVQNLTLNGVESIGATAVSSFSANGIETLNVMTTGGASQVVALTTGAATVNVTGDQNLSVTNMLVGASTIDASKFTGNLTAVADSGALGVTATGGTGMDMVDFSAGFSKGDSFDGGAGVDTIGMLQAVATASAGGTLKNVEQLQVTDAGTGSIDMDGFAGVTKVIYNAGLVAATDIKDAVTGLTVDVNGSTAGQNLKVDLKTDGATDEVSFNFNKVGAGQIVNILDADDAETVNIGVADGTGVAMAGTVTINTLQTQDATKLVLSGDAAVTIANANDPATPVLATIDASKMTDIVSVTGVNLAAGGAVVTLGSGADIFNIATAAGADTFTLGDGADTIVYNAVAQSSAAKVDTITDFKSGTDVINVTAAALLGAAPSTTSFVGNFANFGAAQGALTGGGTRSATFDSSTSTLWVDANGDGTLDANDLQVILTGVTSLTAADLGLSGGVTFTANKAGFNTATAADSVEGNAVTNGNDTINATVAQLVGSTVTGGLAGADILNISGTAAAGEIADLQAIAGTFNSVETVNLDAATEGVSIDVSDLGGANNVGAINGQAGTIQSLTVNNGSNLSAVAIKNIEILNLIANSGVTLTTAQHNGFSFINAPGAETITLNDSGVATGNANVETYVLASGNDTFTVGTAGQSVNVATGGVDTINVGGLALTGTFTGLGATDTINATNNVDFTGATGIGTAILNLTGNGTMTAAQHASFASINGGGTNTLNITTAFIGTTAASIESYVFGNALEHDVTLGNLATNITLGNDDDVLRIGSGAATGTLNGGASGGDANALGENNDTLALSGGANIAGATVSGFEQLGLADGGSFTMTAAQFGTFSNALSGNAGFDASGTETVTLTTTVTDTDAGTLAQAVESYVLASAGNDSFGITDVTTKAAAIDIAAGGNDTITITNAAITAVSNPVVITGFDVTNDDIRTVVGATAHNSGFETVTIADPNIVTAPNGVIEISAAVTQFLNPTDVGNGASVETGFVNAMNTLADGNYTVIGYGNGNAYIYNITMADSNANGLIDLAADVTVELVGQLTGVAADSLDGINFA